MIQRFPNAIEQLIQQAKDSPKVSFLVSLRSGSLARTVLAFASHLLCCSSDVCRTCFRSGEAGCAALRLTSSRRDTDRRFIVFQGRLRSHFWLCQQCFGRAITHFGRGVPTGADMFAKRNCINAGAGCRPARTHMSM